MNSEKEWKRLEGFQGYGNPRSELWFLGIEEKLPWGADEKEELKARATFKKVMDLHLAHMKLGRKVETAKTPTWMWMSKFARALLNEANDWRDRAKARDYKNRCLGRKGGQTFLSELFPFPARTSKDSPSPKRYGNRKVYEQAILPKRRKLLIHMLTKHKPRYVIAYGKKVHYRELFHECGVQVWKRIDGYTQCCRLGKTKIVLIPFFRRGFGHKAVSKAVKWFKDAS